MSQSELDQLLSQLFDEDVKVRLNAAKRLGVLAQPEAIPELARIYEQDDDEGVRKAAAEALRKFRHLERDSQNGAGESGGGSSSQLLLRLRAILLITLTVTVLANVVLVAPRLFVMPVPPTPIQSAPTERSVLIDGLSNRITAVRSLAGLLQNGFRGLQGMGAQALIVNKPICDQLKTTEVNQKHMSDLDRLTYPDLPGISDQINLAALQATSLRGNYLLVCDAKLSTDDLTKQLDQLGGMAKLVSDADAITNQFLGDAGNRLQNAKDHPAPTVGPTFTPTYTETVTPSLTMTLAPATSTRPGATAAPASATASGAIVPAQGTLPAGSPAATITPTATVTPIPSIKFDGFHLDKLASYQYRLSLQADGTYTTGQTFSSSMQFSVVQQNSPLQAQYDIYSSEVGISKGTPGPFGSTSLSGSTTFIVVNNVIYVSGDLLRSISPQAQRCVSLPLAGNEKLIPKLDLTDFTSFQNVSLVVIPLKPGEDVVNGMKVKRFHADQKQETDTALVDLYVTDDDQQLPVKLTATLTTGAPTGGTPSPYQKLVVSVEYNLMAQNPAVNVSKLSNCSSAQPPSANPRPTVKPTAKPKATVKR